MYQIFTIQRSKNPLIFGFCRPLVPGLILKSFLLGNKTEAFENDKEVSDSEKVSDRTDQNYHSDNADDPANEEPELICPRRHTWSHSGSDRKDSFLDQEMFKYL